MKKLNLGTRLVLALALLTGAALLVPHSVYSFEGTGDGQEEYEWVLTPEAAQRTAEDECVPEYGVNGQCLELCVMSRERTTSTGEFDCFPGD